MSDEEFAKIRHDALTSLRQSAHAALEQKMRLGQYAVVIESGEVLQIGPAEIAIRLEMYRANINGSKLEP